MSIPCLLALRYTRRTVPALHPSLSSHNSTRSPTANAGRAAYGLLSSLITLPPALCAYSALSALRIASFPALQTLQAARVVPHAYLHRTALRLAQARPDLVPARAVLQQRALKSSVHLARRDWSWLRGAGLHGWRLIKNAVYMAAIELARVIGQYLGTRHDQLPGWLLRSVSRDEQLQRAGAA